MQLHFSVVITCYREGPLLLEAVESVRQQTYSPVEIILVNDASSDGATNQVCRQLERSQDIQVIWQSTNGGPSVARNAGFSAAKGDILVPLDADDLLPKNAIANIHKAFEQSPQAGFVYGPYIRKDEQNSPGDVIHTQDIQLKHQLVSQPWSLSTNWNLLGTTPLRKSTWETVGGYDPHFGVNDLHDVEFWIRVLASGCNYVAVEEPIYIWRKYLGSNSRKVTPIAWYRIAQKYFDIYQDLGLAYRAYELLLLGSKWLNQPNSIGKHSLALLKCIGRGNMKFSTVVSLIIPSVLLRSLATQAQKQR